MTRGVTYIRIPVHLLSLGLRSAHELVLLGLAVGFNGKGLRMSNAELARLLGTDRRNIPRLVGRLVQQKYLRTETRDGRRIIHPTDIILKSPPDFNLTTKCLQSDDEVTSDLPCPSRSEGTEGSEERRAQRTPRKFTPPTAREVEDYAESLGYTNFPKGQDFVDCYAPRGWRDTKGRPVRDWRAKLRAVWLRDIRKPQRGDPDWLPTEEEADEILAQCGEAIA